VRLSQRSGDDLEQRLERGRAETTTQISQRLLRRTRRSGVRGFYTSSSGT
jgi:hypothetical protein